MFGDFHKDLARSAVLVKANLVEGLEFDLTGKFVKVAATKRYEPLGFNNTTVTRLVLEPFDIDQAKAAWDKRRAQGK